MSFNARLTRVGFGLAALAGATVLLVTACGFSGGSSPVDGSQLMADDDAFGADVPADSPERGQVGDCVHAYESDGTVEGELVECDSGEADYRIYNFATGTLDEADCPLDARGREAEFWYQLDFPDSQQDDYVVCASVLAD